MKRKKNVRGKSLNDTGATTSLLAAERGRLGQAFVRVIAACSLGGGRFCRRYREMRVVGVLSGEPYNQPP